MLRYRTWLAGAVVALAFSAPVTLHAQVVVIANGSPITEYDIQQRMKLEAISQKTPNRQQVITDLIDDRLKIARAKVYGLEIGDSDINGAFENMATRQHITIAQFSQVLERAGISPNTVKARIRAEMTWQQLIRGKYNASLQIGESDIAKALKDKNEGETSGVGYIYTLYPVMVVVARGWPNRLFPPSVAKRRVCDRVSSRAPKASQWRVDYATWRCATQLPGILQI